MDSKSIGSMGWIPLAIIVGCGRDAGESGRQDPRLSPDTATHYPRGTTFDTAHEAPPAAPVPMDTNFRSAPEAGKRLDAGDTSMATPKGNSR